jgi:uncharacterized protein
VADRITVARLNISAVKSLGLSHPSEIRLERFGVAENRRFLLVGADGRVITADRHGDLLRVRSDCDAAGRQLSLRFPDGTVVSDDVAFDGPPFRIELWGRPMSVRAVDGAFSSELGRFIGAPLRIVRTEEPGDGNDEYPVSLVSLASVEELSRRGGRAEPVDPGRFRMLVELDGADPHQEDEWLGRHVGVGEAVIRVADHDARCVITTRNPESGRVDFPTLKVLATYRGTRGKLDFGMYASVVSPGRIAVGDPVRPL